MERSGCWVIDRKRRCVIGTRAICTWKSVLFYRHSRQLPSKMTNHWILAHLLFLSLALHTVDYRWKKVLLGGSVHSCTIVCDVSACERLSRGTHTREKERNVIQNATWPGCCSLASISKVMTHTRQWKATSWHARGAATVSTSRVPLRTVYKNDATRRP